jgi:hypothetical protein
MCKIITITCQINFVCLNQYLLPLQYIPHYITLYSPTRFGARRRHFQGVSCLTVRSSVYKLAVSTGPNVLVKFGLSPMHYFPRFFEDHLW